MLFCREWVVVKYILNKILRKKNPGKKCKASHVKKKIIWNLTNRKENSCRNLHLEKWKHAGAQAALATGGGGGTPLYKVYRYVPPQRVWFLSRFGLKTGIDFDNYGLKSEWMNEWKTSFKCQQYLALKQTNWVGSGFWGREHLRKLTNIFFFSVRNWND